MSDPAPQERSKPIGRIGLRALPAVAAALLAAVAIAGALRVARQTFPSPGIDYFQYWAIAAAVDEGLVEDVYAPPARSRLARIFTGRASRASSQRERRAAAFRRGEIQAASTPLLYAAVHAARSGDYDTDLARHRVAGLVCALGSVLLLCRLAGYSPLRACAVLAAVVWLFAPLRYDLSAGNVNALQLGALSLALGLASRPERLGLVALAGGVLGCVVLFKPNLAWVPLVLLASWGLGDRRRPALALATGAGATAALGLAAASLFFGTARCWLAWLGVVTRLSSEFDVSVAWGNFALGRLLEDALGLDPTLGLNLAALVLFALVLRRRGETAQTGRAAGSRAEDLALVGMAAVVPVLTTDLAWFHYLVLALPLAVYLLRPRPASSLRVGGLALRLAGGAGLVAIASTPWLDRAGVRDPLAHALVLCLGTLALFGATLGELLAPGPSTAHPGPGRQDAA